MKKKIFGGIAVLAFAAIVGLNVKMNASDNPGTGLVLANIEALADHEGPETVIECGSKYGRCWQLPYGGTPISWCYWTGKTLDYCVTINS